MEQRIKSGHNYNTMFSGYANPQGMMGAQGFQGMQNAQQAYLQGMQPGSTMTQGIQPGSRMAQGLQPAGSTMSQGVQPGSFAAQRMSQPSMAQRIPGSTIAPKVPPVMKIAHGFQPASKVASAQSVFNKSGQGVEVFQPKLTDNQRSLLYRPVQNQGKLNMILVLS